MTNKEATPRQLRREIRENILSQPTAGMAPGYLQCNLLILPSAFADEFLDYCEINPSVCPLIAKTKPGIHYFDDLGVDIDIRTDLAGYNVFIDGEKSAEVTSIADYWQTDFVSFAYGCSFSFEALLLDKGITLGYLDRGQREALYLTNIDTNRTDKFAGKLLASMRPLHPKDAIKAISITDKYPQVHGAPVHIGLPELIGVDLGQPYETLGPISIEKEEIPLFWACGVTPQLALINAKLPICITHKSAHMLITDKLVSEFSQ